MEERRILISLALGVNLSETEQLVQLGSGAGKHHQLQQRGKSVDTRVYNSLAVQGDV